MFYHLKNGLEKILSWLVGYRTFSDQFEKAVIVYFLAQGTPLVIEDFGQVIKIQIGDRVVVGLPNEICSAILDNLCYDRK
jgi:hypothetical protein